MGLFRIASKCSALLFWLSAIPIVAISLGFVGRSYPEGVEVEMLKRMNITHEQLVKVWDYRRSIEPAELVSIVSLVGAFSAFVPVVITITEKLSAYGSAAKSIMLPSFCVAVFIVLLELVFTAGRVTSADILAHDRLDEQSLRMLEISTRVNASSWSWLLAFDWVFVGVGMFVAGWMALLSGTFPPGWSFFSIIGSLLCFLHFGFELLRFIAWEEFTALSAIIVIILWILVMPIWLLWGSANIPRASNPIRPSDYGFVDEPQGVLT